MKIIKYNNYSGYKIGGTVSITTANRHFHLQRASWLTAMVESGGKFGCIINYDGTGITAGIHQAIAVYPAELKHPDNDFFDDQGPLWKLLRLIKPQTAFYEFWPYLENELGWTIGLDNKVRYINTGEPVSGLSIRKYFTGSEKGVVPNDPIIQKNVQKVLKIFHDLFTNTRTYDIQENYGITHFAKQADRAKFRFSKLKKIKNLTMDETIYKNTSAELAEFKEDPELDLAICLYWAHSVNAPGIALKILSKTMTDFFAVPRSIWAKRLIRSLGTTHYGRWHDDIPNGRYQRTRKYALESGFWPKELFIGKTAIMPKDL